MDDGDESDREAVDALTRCVGDVGHFARDVWGQGPSLHRSGAPFADLLDVDDVERLLGLLGRRPGFRLVADGATLPLESYTTSVRIGGRLVDEVADLERILERIADGATVVLQGLQRTWLPLSRFCEALERATSHPVQANAYLSPPQAAAFRRHVDEHAVFALQIAGRKTWDVEGLGVLELVAGDALYLPAGTPHEARSTEELSLHVTIGVLAVTWRDVIRRHLADVQELDHPLPLGWARASTHDETATELGRAVDHAVRRLTALEPAEVVDGEAARRRRRQRRLPLGRLRAAVDPSSIDDGARLRRTQPATTATDDGHVELRFGDRTLRMPAIAAGALDVVSSNDVVVVGELPGLDEGGRAVLARRLVREGLLISLED